MLSACLKHLISLCSQCVCVCVSLACITSFSSAVGVWLSRWGMTICKWAVSLTTMKRLMQLIFHYEPSPWILIISNCVCEGQKSGICNSAFRELHRELLKGFIICLLNSLFLLWTWLCGETQCHRLIKSNCFGVGMISPLFPFCLIPWKIKMLYVLEKTFPTGVSECLKKFLLANWKGHSKFIASA